MQKPRQALHQFLLVNQCPIAMFIPGFLVKCGGIVQCLSKCIQVLVVAICISHAH